MAQTLLVVEDDEAARLLYSEEFKELGLKVLTAENGMRALEILEREPVDVVMTDLRMPEVGGIEMIPYLKKHYPRLPVVVVTAYPQYKELILGVEPNVRGFFTKPVMMSDLRTLISEIMGEIGPANLRPVD